MQGPSRFVTVDGVTVQEASIYEGFPRVAALALGGDSERSTVVPYDMSGDGAPTHDAPNGSTWRRRDGAADTTLYVRVAGAWVAIEGAGGAVSGTTVTATTSVVTDTIAERTSAAGVTVDGCLIKDGRAALLATASMFASTEQTGTGSSQDIAHGFGAAPSLVWWSISEAAAGLAGGLDVTPGTHDATNIKITVTNGIKFFVFALK